MKKIELSDYEFDVGTREVPMKKSYEVKESYVNLLLSPLLKLNGRELLLSQKLASKILESKEDYILLEGVDYDKLCKAVNAHEGFSKHDIELVRRVLEAPDVKVDEVK